MNANSSRPLYERRVIELRQDMLGLLETQTQKFLANIADLTQMVLKKINHYRIDGPATPFVIMPFADGSIPNKLPHLLPPLTNRHIINHLTPEQLVRYCVGYGIAHDPRNVDLMLVDLKAYIGCKA